MFKKCIYLPEHFDSDITDDFEHSFVICQELIDFLITNIFDNNPNNSLIEILKKNFLDYFYLETESDLSEKSLDFRTFKEILIKSINQIKMIETKETQLNRNSYLCDRKLKNLKYSFSCYEKLSSIHDNKLDSHLKFKDLNEFGKMKLSNKSLSLSDHELNQSYEFEIYGKNLKFELNLTKSELADLKSENFKLRDQIENLREQLHLAEDTNSQMFIELENQHRILSEQIKKNADFQSKIMFYEKDVEDLRVANDGLRKELSALLEKNLNLNQILEENSFLISDKDKQLAKQIEDSQIKVQNFIIELEEQRVEFF